MFTYHSTSTSNNFNDSFHYYHLAQKLCVINKNKHYIRSLPRPLICTKKISVAYFIAHTEQKKGMQLNNGLYADSNQLKTIFFDKYSTQLVFLNTCYGIESGIAHAAMDSGTKIVIAASGTIPVKYMTHYSELFFKTWIEDKVDVRKALEIANKKFMNKDIQFTFLGNGKMTFISLNNTALTKYNQRYGH